MCYSSVLIFSCRHRLTEIQMCDSAKAAKNNNAHRDGCFAGLGSWLFGPSSSKSSSRPRPCRKPTVTRPVYPGRPCDTCYHATKPQLPPLCLARPDPSSSSSSSTHPASPDWDQAFIPTRSAPQPSMQQQQQRRQRQRQHTDKPLPPTPLSQWRQDPSSFQRLSFAERIAAREREQQQHPRPHQHQLLRQQHPRPHQHQLLRQQHHQQSRIPVPPPPRVHTRTAPVPPTITTTATRRTTTPTTKLQKRHHRPGSASTSSSNSSRKHLLLSSSRPSPHTPSSGKKRQHLNNIGNRLSSCLRNPSEESLVCIDARRVEQMGRRR